jgi:hypothetical protein
MLDLLFFLFFFINSKKLAKKPIRDIGSEGGGVFRDNVAN